MTALASPGNGFGVYRRKSDGRLIVNYKDEHDRPRQETKIRKVAEANAFCRRKYREWPGPKKIDVSWTVPELIGEYLEWRESQHELTGEPAASTLDGDRAAAKRIVKRWPKLAVGAMTKRESAAWIKSMRTEGRKGNTIRIYTSSLRCAYQWAIDNHLLDMDAPPIPEVSVTDAKGGQTLTLAQLHDMLEHVQPDYRVMFLTLAFSGMRISEVCALDVTSLHRKGSYLVGGMKTEAGKNRKVSIPEWLVQVLVDHIGDRTEGPLFLNRRGNRVTRRAFTRTHWDPAAEAIGVPDATPHWTRHSLATSQAADGRNVFELLEHFGWKDLRIASRYIHAAGDGVTAIGKSLEAARPPLRAVK